MRKFKFSKPNLKRACSIAAIACMLLMSGKAFANSETLEVLNTQDFIEWQALNEDEKADVVIPRLSTTLISDELLENFSGNRYVNGIRAQILERGFDIENARSLVGASYSSSYYDLNQDIKVNVKHQGITNECWAFSTTTALETNLAKMKKINKVFSVRHMDYSSVRTFTDGINPLGLNREAGDGGLAPFGLAYLTNGQGAVLEDNMPFQNNENKISLSELDKEVDTIVTDYIELPAIYKEYAKDNGEVVYTNGGSGSNLVIYEDNEVKAMRNIIKNQIVTYGAVSAVTASNETQFYDNPSDITKAKAYFCNDNSKVRDHAVTIVGWNDNYSRDNFKGAAKPYSNGAWIVLNSYGTTNFDQGYMYISYEDSLIETMLYGIQGTSDVDYDNLYQYNEFGNNTVLGMSGRSEGYIASIYDRDSRKNESLEYVGVTIPDDLKLEIYVNPNGSSTTPNNLVKVATTNTLQAGYHRIKINPIDLKATKFAIVIKEISEEGRFYFSVETGVDNSIYSTIQGNPGKNLYSTDGNTWKVISNEKISGLDMQRSDLTIKAFTNNVEKKPTQEPEEPNEDPNTTEDPSKLTLKSNVYTLRNTTDIYKIQPDTKCSELKKNIITNDTGYEIYKTDGTKVNDSEIIKTGMTLKLSDNTVYTLIVRGDIDCDGTVALLDLSKFLAHWSEDPHFQLKGIYLKAADLSCDGVIDLLDLSQLLVLYAHM